MKVYRWEIHRTKWEICPSPNLISEVSTGPQEDGWMCITQLEVVMLSWRCIRNTRHSTTWCGQHFKECPGFKAFHWSRALDKVIWWTSRPVVWRDISLHRTPIPARNIELQCAARCKFGRFFRYLIFKKNNWNPTSETHFDVLGEQSPHDLSCRIPTLPGEKE